MFNTTETEERRYLEVIKVKLREALEEIQSHVVRRAKEIKEHKAFLWENKTGMDHAEKISMRQSIDMSVLTGESMLAKQKRIQKLLPSPYFGRVDFIKEGETQRLPVYIGVNAFFDAKNNTSLIHDWRAPVSTMFYDFETGKAHFDAPEGRVTGEIVLKRQYRIRKGEMEFMLESDISVLDDVLQKELSAASDDKMKNIVATIQRDQNAIIRNEDSDVLIIQGVAGSGKTSIALHRVAFLLYRFKESLSSKDILIISPNKVFADFIANVLPELGEEKIPETGIEELARELLGREVKFQTFFEQVSLLLEKENRAFQRRIQSKASLEFLNKLNTYIDHVESSYFSAVDIRIKGRIVPAKFMQERFQAQLNLPVFTRLDKIAGDVEKNIAIYYHYDITAKERADIKIAVRKMFKFSTLRQLYKDFYDWLGQPELFKSAKGSVLEYADVFPLIYLKLRIEGIRPREDVKHLLVDEMQDYTPLQYTVLSQLFPCRKTILGDANQSVNPFSSSSSEDIQKVIEGADCVKLCKSYRSTYEITQFAQRISRNNDLEIVERHGESPTVLKFNAKGDEFRGIMRLVRGFEISGYPSMGIICKTQKQAEHLHRQLQSAGFKVYLLSVQSDVFRKGVVICTAHMAKGLEFDHVLVPEASEENYATAVDKSMLYVACTRAMHQLSVTCVGTLTSFLQKEAVS